MERVISQEERIRRAEEIYQRRNNYNGVREKSPKGKMKKRLVRKCIICLIIYFAIYSARGADVTSFASITETIKDNVKKDINIEVIKDKIRKWVIEEPATEQKVPEENTEVKNEESVVEEQQNVAQVEETPKSQEELDVEKLKEKGIIWPAEGRITSGFGEREATEIISGNHHGIDIGANEGSSVVAAIDGTVSLASEEGSYGKHIKIENENITTLYAHCSKLLVSEGQQVSKGEEIAKVGQTRKGNSDHICILKLR